MKQGEKNLTTEPQYGSVVSVSVQEAREVLQSELKQSSCKFPDLAHAVLDLGFQCQFDPDAVGTLEKRIGAKIDDTLKASGFN